MRVWLPPFSPRLTELTSGLFGRLVGKPLQCCSRCRQGRPSTHRWRHTYTPKPAHTHTHTVHTTLRTSIHLGVMHTNTHERACASVCTDASTITDVERVKATVSYRQTNTHTNPVSDPDGDRAAADVVGRAGALLAQVTCSQQLAQVRHSWELKPQGKCSRWLGGWRCGRQAGRLAHHCSSTHTHTHTLREMDESRREKNTHMNTVTDIQRY